MQDHISTAEKRYRTFMYWNQYTGDSHGAAARLDEYREGNPNFTVKWAASRMFRNQVCVWVCERGGGRGGLRLSTPLLSSLARVVRLIRVRCGVVCAFGHWYLCAPVFARRYAHFLAGRTMSFILLSTMTCATVSHESHPHPRPFDVSQTPPIPCPLLFQRSLIPIIACVSLPTPPFAVSHGSPDGGPLTHSRVPPLGARARPP